MLIITAWVLSVGLRGQAASSVEAVSVADPKLRPIAASGGESSSAALSDDGRFVTFVSGAANLVTNAHRDLTLDVYVRDRQSGLITLVSISTDGRTGGNAHSVGPSLSGDGRWVVFESRASNLVTNQTTGLGDIYARDLTSGITRLVSINAEGQGGNGISTGASITLDGRWVVFESSASNLATNDANQATDVFLHDLKTGVTTLVSQNWLGTASAEASSAFPEASTDVTITPDGRYVVFQSYATNLVSPALLPDNFAQQSYLEVYVRDMLAKTNLLVSVNVAGQAGNSDSTGPVISSDGRYVAFQSGATNLVANQPFQRSSCIFRRDLQTATTLLISQAQSASTNSSATQPALSSDGRVIPYAMNWVTNLQVFVWSETVGTDWLLSTNSTGQPGLGYAGSPLVSADGRTIVFESSAVDIVPGVTNGNYQIFAYDLATGTHRIESASPSSPAGSAADCFYPTISADGRIVAFETYDSGLVPGDNNRGNDVFVRDLTSSTIELVSTGLASLPAITAGASSAFPDNGISADGRYVVYMSVANNIVPNDNNGTYDVFVRDTVSSSNILVSVNRDGTGSGNGSSFSPMITPDGRFVTFISGATNLVDVDANNMDDVFVRDVFMGTTTMASIRPADALSLVLSISPNTVLTSAEGRYVAILLTASQSPRQLILRDLQMGTTTTVSNSVSYATTQLLPVAFTDGQRLWYLSGRSGSLVLNRYDIQSGVSELIISNSIRLGSTIPAITPNGRFVAGLWLTDTTNWVWCYDTINNNLQTLVSSGQSGSSTSVKSQLAISADGRFIAYYSPISPNSPADTNSMSQVYVADALQPGIIQLVSINQAGTSPGNGPSDRIDLSADGRFVTFRSSATDLTVGISNNVPNLFVRDLQTGVTRLVSVNQAGMAGDSRSYYSWISADGTKVAFESSAGDLVVGDYNSLPDIFLYHVSLLPEIRLRLLPLALGGRPSIVWTADSGKNYRVQFKNTLMAPDWTELIGTPVAYGTSEWRFEDSSNVLGNQRFYRVILTP